jgi:hypothetical protein
MYISVKRILHKTNLSPEECKEISTFYTFKCETSNADRISMGNLIAKSLLGYPRINLEDNIKMNLRELGCEDGMVSG